MTQRVSITRVENCDFDRAVAEALDLAGGFAELIKPDSRVVVKPNLNRPAPSGSGAVTDARMTEAVTKAVLDMRPASVVIADGTSVGYDDGSFSTEDVFEVTGTFAVAQRLGVPCVFLNSDEAVTLRVPEPRVMERVLVARTIVESDVVISVPVLKTHPRTVLTNSLKNLFGAVVGIEKRTSHMLGINEALVDIFSVLRPAYSIVDANVASEGVWRVPEDSRVMGLVLAAKDALAVDVVGSALIGIDPHSVFYLRAMMEWAGEVHGLDDIEIVGESLWDNAERFKPSFDVFMEAFPDVTVVTGDEFCGGCIAELLSALKHLKQAGYEAEMKGLKILVGNPTEFEPGDKMVVIGGCSEELEDVGHVASGCPPNEDDVLEAICEACGAEPSLVMSIRDETRRKIWDSTRDVITR
ncbi:MAG: DUF362 domain-containing protein [Dehalococcoidia bacterium]|nr:DUF362 domain-containing protein [Dehalococcoidia bacterium]